MIAELITGYDEGYAPLAALTVPVMRRYAARHGFDFSIFRMKPIDRPIGWSAIIAMKEALARGADPAIWIDIDAVIVRPDLNIADALQPGKDIYCVMQPRGGYPELGVWMLRNTEWSRWILDAMWNGRLLPEHGCWHQAAFCQLAGLRACLGRGESDDPNEEILSHVGWLDSRWNVIDCVHPDADAYIHHYAGISLRHKIAFVWRDVSPLLGGAICRLVALEDRMAAKAEVRPAARYTWRRNLARTVLRLVSPDMPPPRLDTGISPS